MWDVNGGLIQVEVGENVVKEYTRKQGLLDMLFGSSEAYQEGQLFIEYSKALRAELAQQGVELPPIAFRDDSSLGGSEFRIYVGADWVVGNTRQHDLMGTVKHMVLRRQRPGMSAQAVQEELASGAELLRGRSFNRAVESLSSVYYWASELDCTEELVNASLNLGVINLRNNRLDAALLFARRACVLAEDGGFHDPYLRFGAHNFLANMYWLTDNASLAVKNYTLAVDDVRYLDDVPLRIFALWNANCACFITGKYDVCSEALDEIYGMIVNDDSYPKQMVEQLYAYKAAVCRNQISIAMPVRESLAPKFTLRGLAEGIMAFANSHLGMQVVSLFGNFVGSVLRGLFAEGINGQINYKSNNTLNSYNTQNSNNQC